MANTTVNLVPKIVGKAGRNMNLPVAASTTLYTGIFLSQSSTGGLVPTTTSGAGPCVGYCLDSVDNSAGALDAKRVMMYTDTIVKVACGTTTNAFTEANNLFCPVYATDDHTVTPDGGAAAGTNAFVGLYCGLCEDGEVLVYVGHFSGARTAEKAARVATLGAFAAGDNAPADLVNGAIYDIPTTAANSTVTLPAAAGYDGIAVHFVADGTKNGHTVQYRDATGPVNLTTALTASKRHMVTARALGGLWFASAYISP